MTNKTTPNWTASDDRMVEDAIRRGATRRDLLRMLSAGGIAALAGGSILTRASAAFASTPVAGGFIKVAGASSSTADTLDPAKASNSTDYSRICSIYNRLTFLDTAGAVQMELADSIDSSDAKTWTVKLKSGVTFHSGKSLTAQDVVYSLARHLDEAVGSKVNSIAAQMESISAVDDLTVSIVLASPNADLPIILALHHFMIIADGTTDFSAPDGTGAFKVERFEPGVTSILVKNENYFKANAPYLDGFEFFAIRDEPARVNALMSGDVHVASAVKPQSMRLIETNSSIKTLTTTAGNYTNMNMRLDMSPGDKADFVEGMKYLLNREQIQKSVMRGLAVIANDQPVSPSSKYYNADLKPRDFDPERAKSLFEKAGVLGQSIPVLILTLTAIYAPGSYRFARALSVNINTMDFVTVARARGEGTLYLIREEILPNILGPVLADFGLRFVFIVLLLSGLSFLGLGVLPPNADWGALVKENISGLPFAAPAVVYPSVAIASLTISVNMLIDNLPKKIRDRED